MVSISFSYPGAKKKNLLLAVRGENSKQAKHLETYQVVLLTFTKDDFLAITIHWSLISHRERCIYPTLGDRKLLRRLQPRKTGSMKDRFDHKLIENAPFYNPSPNQECSSRMGPYITAAAKAWELTLTIWKGIPREVQRQATLKEHPRTIWSLWNLHKVHRAQLLAKWTWATKGFFFSSLPHIDE